MQKAQTLRTAIETMLPGLTTNPETFWMVVNKGRINQTATRSPNFQWTTTLAVSDPHAQPNCGLSLAYPQGHSAN